MTSFLIHMGLFISAFLKAQDPAGGFFSSHGAATYPFQKPTDGNTSQNSKGAQM